MPGAKYARGSEAWGLCQRCGLRFFLTDLVFDGYMPGLRVCDGCYDPKHPQEFLQDVTDPIALWKPAPDSVAIVLPVLTLVQVGPPVKLSWTPADFDAYTVGTYEVWRAIQGQAYVKLATFTNVENLFADGRPSIIQTSSYTDSTVVLGTTYLYQVIARSLAPNAFASGN